MPLGLIALFTSLLFFPMPGVGIVGLCSVYSLRGEFDSENRKLEKTPVILVISCKSFWLYEGEQREKVKEGHPLFELIVRVSPGRVG